MSLATYKRKAEQKYASRGSTSANKPAIKGKWIARAFSVAETSATVNLNGHSINGGTRGYTNYAGMRMGKVHTPYKGAHAVGHGGKNGEYDTSGNVWAVNDARVVVEASQAHHIKPSSMSAFGRLQNRYRELYSGQYPNYWVQSEYTGNQTDNGSSSSRTARYAAEQLCAGEGLSYSENPRITAGSSSEYTLYRQRKCLAMEPEQEHFPFAVSGTGASTNPHYVNPYTQLGIILENLAKFWSTDPNDSTTIILKSEDDEFTSCYIEGLEVCGELYIYLNEDDDAKIEVTAFLEDLERRVQLIAEQRQ